MDKAKIEELRKAAKRAAEAMNWRFPGAYPWTFSADHETVLALLDHIDGLTAERDALAAKPVALERLTCWLIEMPATSEWPAIWLTITTDGRRWSSDGGTLYATGGNLYFTTAAIEALKFADEESANAYVRHNKIKDVVVTEHIFDNSAILNARPVPTTPASAGKVE